MQVPSRFDTIRPVEPEELQQALSTLLADSQFISALTAMPENLLGASESEDKGNFAAMLTQMATKCHTNLDFQKVFVYPLIKTLVQKLTTSCTIDAEAIADKSAPHTFVSNHRDIVLDSALLAMLLIDAGFPDTVEIAIGDNLLAYPWIEQLVRVNKAFIVRRGLGLRETLEASRLLSEYMHFAIAQKHQNIWIAQREGRAKDSNDRTQEALLKMMCMGGTGTPTDRIRELRLTPLAISYEYDPCDYLKAKEFQLKRDNPDYKKSRQDDLVNMRTGIFGFKGRVHYHICSPTHQWLDSNKNLPKADFFPALAHHIDREIHSHYSLFPSNFVALDLLEGSHCGCYTDEERTRFEQYVESRIALVDLPNPDVAFLKERILTMYANPVRNYLATRS